MGWAMIKPASILHINATGEIWEARQDYLRLGTIIHVSGWGGTRAEAIKALERARFWADQPSRQPFKALDDILWATAGAIVSLIRFLGGIKARLMEKTDN